MEWKMFFLQLMLELGGLTGIAILGLKFLGNLFFERSLRQYELKLNEKLESHKNSIENKSYVSKTKFDAIFQIFCEISESLISCFDLIKEITPENGTELDNSIDSVELIKVIENFKKIISRNMPIMPKNLYDQLLNTYNIFCQQVSNYDKLLSDTDDEINYFSRDELLREENNVYIMLRQYYDKLEITSD